MPTIRRSVVTVSKTGKCFGRFYGVVTGCQVNINYSMNRGCVLSRLLIDRYRLNLAKASGQDHAACEGEYTLMQFRSLRFASYSAESAAASKPASVTTLSFAERS